MSSKVKLPSKSTDVDNIAKNAIKQAEDITGVSSKLFKGAVALVAGATILDMGMSMYDSAKAKSDMKKQNKKIDRQQEEEYEEMIRRKNQREGMYFNLNQQLFYNRSNHSNTWGGRRY